MELFLTIPFAYKPVQLLGFFSRVKPLQSAHSKEDILHYCDYYYWEQILNQQLMASSYTSTRTVEEDGVTALNSHISAINLATSILSLCRHSQQNPGRRV